MCGASPYSHSRAIRYQLPRGRSWLMTASVIISSRRPKTCSAGRVSRRTSWNASWSGSEKSRTIRVAAPGSSSTISSAVYHHV